MIVNNGIPYRDKAYIAGRFRYEDEFLEFIEWLGVGETVNAIYEGLTEHELGDLWRQFEYEK